MYRDITYLTYKHIGLLAIYWFITPLTIDISPINHSELGVMWRPTERDLAHWGTTDSMTDALAGSRKHDARAEAV